MHTGSGIGAIRALVEAGIKRASAPEGEGARRVLRPVVTISRETGAGVIAVAEQLAARLSSGGDPWSVYDRELLERISADHDLSLRIVESLDERDKSWFEHLTAGLSFQDTGLDLPLKAARTIFGMSRAGYGIIVGRGSQMVLHGLPNVVHVRLIAPLDWRVQHICELENVSAEEAGKIIQTRDRSREQYVKRHFRRNVADPLLYHVVINRGSVDAETAAEMIEDVVASVTATLES